MRTLAHLSDLHFGLSSRTEQTAATLCDALLAAGVERVVVTGDVTHRGRIREMAAFLRTFAPLLPRLLIVPGNHDRLGEDVAAAMITERVEVAESEGLFVIRADSTGPHNRTLLNGHGLLTDADLDAIQAALSHAPRGALVVLALHHHPLPLPEEWLGERLVSWLGWPHAAELRTGRRLLERVRGRCDLVLHGHRHVPSAFHLFTEEARPLVVYNAGSSTQLGRARIFAHRGGALAGPPRWLDIATEAPPVRHAPATVRV